MDIIVAVNVNYFVFSISSFRFNIFTFLFTLCQMRNRRIQLPYLALINAIILYHLKTLVILYHLKTLVILHHLKTLVILLCLVSLHVGHIYIGTVSI